MLCLLLILSLYSIQNYYPLQTRTLQGFESSCPLLKKDFGKNYCPCPLLKKQLPQKCSSCLLLKKQIKNKYFSCLLFLTTTFLSSATLKNDDSFDKIILKSCSLQCVLHGAAKPPKAVGYTVTAVSAYFYKHEINHEEVAPCCQTRTPRTPIFSLLLIC